MQSHLLVSLLRVARRLEGVSGEDGIRRIMPMNCISWMVGHAALQEHNYWVILDHAKVPEFVGDMSAAVYKLEE